MTRRISETVTWFAFVGAAEDSHGNEADSWAAGVSVGVFGFDPGSSSEPRTPGTDARVIVEPTLYLPAAEVFASRDRVSVRGLLYEVEGETREWRHPSDGAKGNVVSLRRVDG